MVDLNRLREQARRGDVRPVPPVRTAPPGSPGPPRRKRPLLTFLVLIAAAGGGIWLWQANQQTPAPAPVEEALDIQLTEIALATGVSGDTPTGVAGGSNPTFESPSSVVFFVRYQYAVPGRDRIAVQVLSGGEPSHSCGELQIVYGGASVECTVNGLRAGAYEFQLFVNDQPGLSYPFQVSDRRRVSEMVTFGSVLRYANDPLPAPGSAVYLEDPSPAALYVEYENARKGDLITAALFRDSYEMSGCYDFALTNVPSGAYTCQLEGLSAGIYQFRLRVNGAEVGQYPFSVTERIVADIPPPYQPVQPTSPVYPAPAPARPLYTGPPPIQEARWSRKASENDFASAYPRNARRRGISGDVTLACWVENGGRLSCSVESEFPTGEGFGAAAVEIAGEYRMAGTLNDGTASIGRPYKFQFSFEP